ncbi:MAG TPA: hypothetical protein VJB87_05045 [Candidatus Nanoarchaeia archaeon]|nr:hypothetical protein [Candidatus Nanoarchaeia archaeon]
MSKVSIRADDSLSPLQKVHFASLRPTSYSRKKSLQDIVYVDLDETHVPPGREEDCTAYHLSYAGALDVLLRDNADVLPADKVAEVFLTANKNISLMHTVVRNAVVYHPTLPPLLVADSPAVTLEHAYLAEGITPPEMPKDLVDELYATAEKESSLPLVDRSVVRCDVFSCLPAHRNIAPKELANEVVGQWLFKDKVRDWSSYLASYSGKCPMGNDSKSLTLGFLHEERPYPFLRQIRFSCFYGISANTQGFMGFLMGRKRLRSTA